MAQFSGASTALQPGGNFILFVCRFVCLLLLFSFTENRENLDSEYQIALLRADLWKILFPVSSVCHGLECLGYFSARCLVGFIVKD